MKFLSASYLLVCDDKFSIIENGVVVFDKTIHFVGTLEQFKKQYPNKPIEFLGKNSVLMPGFINSHIHLEFSANKTILEYGDFIKWLFSVIKHREDLIHNNLEKIIDNELSNMLKKGTTTIGAISSYGYDLKSCIKTPINVVYFTEILGSKPDMIDTIFSDFKAKLSQANSHKTDNFIPAIAIHSPYSTHPILIREILKIAKENNYAVSAHFLESTAEKEWLENSTGDFVPFFKNLLNQTKSLTNANDFLSQFLDIKNLSFTHCTKANKQELEKIEQLKASIIHCPTSNRLLTNTKLNLTQLNNINIALGTDGLSSNNNLDILSELHNALFIHTNINLNDLAIQLLLASTNGGGKTLGLKKGILKKDYDSDIISFTLPQDTQKENLPYSIILHTKSIDNIFINGVGY